MYKVSEKLRELKARLIDIDGDTLDVETGEVLGAEDAATLEAQLMHELLSDQADGAEAALKIIKELEALSIGAKSEIDRLTVINAARKSKIERLKDSVRISMLDTDQQSIETTVGTFKINKGRESVIVNDQSKLPAEFIRTKVTESADKTAIKNAIKGGDFDLPSAAEIVRGEPTLSIK